MLKLYIIIFEKGTDKTGQKSLWNPYVIMVETDYLDKKAFIIRSFKTLFFPIKIIHRFFSAVLCIIYSLILYVHNF